MSWGYRIKTVRTEIHLATPVGANARWESELMVDQKVWYGECGERKGTYFKVIVEYYGIFCNCWISSSCIYYLIFANPARPAMWLLRLQKLEGEREDRRVQFGLGFGPLRRLKNCKAKGGCVHCPQVCEKNLGALSLTGIFFSTTSIQKFEHVTCFILFLQDGGVGWVDDQLATVLFFEARQPFWLRSWVSTCSHEDEHPHEHSQCFEKDP